MSPWHLLEGGASKENQSEENPCTCVHAPRIGGRGRGREHWEKGMEGEKEGEREQGSKGIQGGVEGGRGRRVPITFVGAEKKICGESNP